MKGLDNLVQIITFGVFFYASFLATLHYMRNRVKWFQSIPEKLQPNTSLRLVSSIHSTIAVILSIYILYTDNDLSQSKILYNSPAISFTLNLTTGFLLYDCLLLAVYREEFEWYYVVHHFVSIVAFYACSTYGVFPYIALFRLLSEASSIFINFRWIILTLKMKESSIYIYNTLAAVVVFFFIRILTIVPNWWFFFESVNTPDWFKVALIHKIICVGATVPLDLLNIYWFSKIINLIKKYYYNKNNVNETKTKPTSISEKYD